MAVEGRYITLDVSSDDESNKYNHWDMVLDYMAPYLKEKNITVVQLGNKAVSYTHLRAHETDS